MTARFTAGLLYDVVKACEAHGYRLLGDPGALARMQLALLGVLHHNAPSPAPAESRSGALCTSCGRLPPHEGEPCKLVARELERCADCGEPGERTGQQTCQYPGRHEDKGVRHG